MLTWWQGRDPRARLRPGRGRDLQHLLPAGRARSSAGNGYHADLHEFRLTPQGTAWIDAFDPVEMNLSSYGGSSDGVAHRLGRPGDRRQDRPGDVGVARARAHPAARILRPDAAHTSYPWDYVHINSIDPGPERRRAALLAQHVDDLRRRASHSGGVRWRIGGAHSSFKQRRRHALLLAARRRLAARGPRSRCSTTARRRRRRSSRAGCCWIPTPPTHTVTLVKQFTNPTKTLLASSQGNLLSLPDGNWLMGYGGLPNFTEYDSAGHVLLDGTLGQDVQDFRTYLAPWSATAPRPARRSLASAAGAGTATVAVSWNGATSVASWRVLAGASAASLQPGRERAEVRLPDDADGQRRRSVCGRAGARRLGQRARDVGNGQGVSGRRARVRVALLLAALRAARGGRGRARGTPLVRTGARRRAAFRNRASRRAACRRG